VTAGSKLVRQNIAKINPDERKKFRDAIVKLNKKYYPGSKDDFRPKDPGPYKPAGHVSYWFKQDEIHQATHVHNAPAFLPWHRELCNRFEKMLQDIDDTVALHYWDWRSDPRASPDGKGGVVNLCTDDCMGNPIGRAGPPFDTFDNNGILAGSRDETGNPADPPQIIGIDINGAGVGRHNEIGPPDIAPDIDIVRAGDNRPPQQQFRRFNTAMNTPHGTGHYYLGGTILDAHTAFRHPMVFLLHSNIDRLWASWQRKKGQEWRLDPDRVYGELSGTVAQGTVPGILTPLEPWAGVNAPGIEDEVFPARPWAEPENEQLDPANQKNSRHISVVTPPEYDEYVTIPP